MTATCNAAVRAGGLPGDVASRLSARRLAVPSEVLDSPHEHVLRVWPKNAHTRARTAY